MVDADRSVPEKTEKAGEGFVSSFGREAFSAVLHSLRRMALSFCHFVKLTKIAFNYVGGKYELTQLRRVFIKRSELVQVSSTGADNERVIGSLLFHEAIELH
uniref:hypothetical protein n=1 Tax=Paenibacillus puerhi TaxID=2692622 RepID=UPI0019162E1F